MRDFTLAIYNKLLGEFLHAGYGFVTFTEYIQDSDKKEKTLILRHDVDKNPLRSLRTAELENKLGIEGTYYFRVVKNKLPREVIRHILKLGHEIGYHYDDLKDAGGNVKKALGLFQKNLAQLRELAPIKTACMHGSPLSRHDNRDLWEKFDYHEFGIIGEPYFDIDFNRVMYLTDTGRRWDGEKVSIRDKVIGDGLGVRGKTEDTGEKSEDRGQIEEGCRGGVHSLGEQTNRIRQDRRMIGAATSPVFNLHSTGDIIKALQNNLLPKKIMLTVHPQRWVDNYFLWTKELVWQKIKNGVKYFLVKDIR